MKKKTPLIILTVLAVSAGLHAGGRTEAPAGGMPPVYWEEQNMKQTISGPWSNPARPGPAENFTGNVMVETVYLPESPSIQYGSYVHFEAGARSAWHTHESGQILVVVSGTCWTRERGGRKQIALPGDVIHCPPGITHWHGASPDGAMTHIALGEAGGSGGLTWLEKVSDADYMGSGTGGAENQKVIRLGDGESRRNPEENFTGAVFLESAFSAMSPSLLSGSFVSFEPGARSAWHTHGSGQTLIVTSGICWTQELAGRRSEVRAGGIVRCPPGVTHWHGASPGAAMTHLAIGESIPGAEFAWLEKVSDAEYLGGVLEPEQSHDRLSKRQRSIVSIAACTTRGDLERLKTSINTGLDAGLTVNEVTEILTQLYAYSGFPRSLNALGNLSAVLEERKARGITDVQGREARPLPTEIDKDSYGANVRAQLTGMPIVSGGPSTAIDSFLKEHLFADIFARDILDYQSRELATVGGLSGLDGVNPQLRSHMNIALNTGITESQLREVTAVIRETLGKQVGDNAASVLGEVLAQRN
ncbi:cupin domain-containing protein [Brucepastera parasyntrophica]|uniref:(R)-mandelonitrile lyase n=1 Tax=Brucepastera parasyntrophica TaxID=2880008 RepID=UPI00210C6586|nr:cupin domain-containing protein [Brucepastera parasyntrophica]ULQ60440.1 cupin domain-containing protein [Brucepastera parasyntrophica]